MVAKQITRTVWGVDDATRFKAQCKALGWWADWVYKDGRAQVWVDPNMPRDRFDSAMRALGYRVHGDPLPPKKTPRG